LIVVTTKDGSQASKKLTAEDCSDGLEATAVKISTSPGLFDDLSSEEMKKVYDYMLTVKSLNLKPSKDAQLNSNHIVLIQFYPPSKDKALAYLDQSKAKPERQALVVIFKGAAQPPVVEEYLVGPTSAPTKHELLKVDGRSYPIHFNARPAFSPQEEIPFYNVIVVPMAIKLHRLFKESYDGYTFINCTDQCLYLQLGAPFGLTSDTRENWYMLMRQELIDAYDNGRLVKTFLPAPKGKDKLFSTYERRGKQQPSKPSRGPEQYEPDGKRYSVQGRHIEYMNWAFDFRIDSSTGLQVFDIRFGGERIAYEISLQEAIATYAGYFPTQMGNNFLDGSYMMGATSYDLLQGVDCPGTGTFFDLVHMVYTDTPHTLKNAVCVFELNTGIPLRRHYDNDFKGGYTFYGGMVNQALVLRNIAVVANYDYVHDFIFYQNGAVEVKVSASGFTFGTFYDQNVEPYGYPIHNNLTSTTHDHLLNYKVDLDVGGRVNSYETIEVGIENVTDKWLPEKNRHFLRKVLKRSTKKTEQEAAYKFNFDRPKYLNFYNEKSRNKMGVPKGYRIQLNGIMKQLYPEDWLMVPMMSWSLYQVAVTRYKDSERQSSSQYNQNAPTDPHVDFRDFLADNEDIVNQDLVAWVTTGMMHIPHSEDVPTTATVGSSAGFYLRPFHYFDEDPSMGSSNAVLIKPTDKNYSPSFQRFGTPTGPVCIPRDYSVSFDGRNNI
ncbi:hypothetical protein QZH41_016553, partial [Actinostola sp. cb2023]